ncbi:hypothetical protein ABCS02_22835 [Microbacterium sp. X-17]|uniref:hypothetical protein n=1 Tax=Microbacterium sp. X-17 TaxID=3144404 RepID=UPI0031F4983A
MAENDDWIVFDTADRSPENWLSLGDQVPLRGAVLEGDYGAGFMHWVRNDNKSEKPHALKCGIHRTDVDTAIHVDGSSGHEFTCIIEGTLTVELDDGRTFVLEPGMTAHFKPGHPGTYRYKAPFRQFVVVAYGQDTP